MSALALIKAVHYLALAVLVCVSAYKNHLLTPPLIARAVLRRVLRYEKISAAAAGLMLISGTSMALWFARPTAYYVQNPWFWLKISVFFIASGLIVWSKLRLRELANNTALANYPISTQVRWILRLDFAGLLLMLALGWGIARNYF